MKIGIFYTSLKKHEKRIPIHPEHLNLLEKGIIKHLYFENNYALDYGYDKGYFDKYDVNFLSREDLFRYCDLLVIPKTTVEDLKNVNNGQILWGWHHCTQQKKIVEAAIGKRATLIAWEEMYSYNKNNEKLMHIFYRNNELAGYAAVMHALQLTGKSGIFEMDLKIAIIGFGAVSRGSVFAFQSCGLHNINIYTFREAHLVHDKFPHIKHNTIKKIEHNQYQVILHNGNSTTLFEEIKNADIIVNGIMQDPLNPHIFVYNSDIRKLKSRTLILDLSCDEGMGFEFAAPTTFDIPLIKLDNDLLYYSVDHAPNYFWNTASREISNALVPYLNELYLTNFEIEKIDILKKAIQIERGEILNNNIIRFQERSSIYPYDYLKNEIIEIK